MAGGAGERARSGTVRSALRRARLPGAAPVLVDLPPDRAALTFDDGPHPVGTPAVLDALAATATTATFFLLSAQATAHPGVVGDLLAAGHTVGLHSDRHERLDRVPLRALTTRLADARRRLEDLIGAPVQWHRPPFGRLSWRGSLAARRAGLAIALWNEAPRDWQAANVAELAARLGPCLRAGALLALHDGDDPPGQAFVTAGALRLVLGAGTPEGVALGPLPPPDAARCVKPLRPHW